MDILGTTVLTMPDCPDWLAGDPHDQDDIIQID